MRGEQWVVLFTVGELYPQLQRQVPKFIRFGILTVMITSEKCIQCVYLINVNTPWTNKIMVWCGQESISQPSAFIQIISDSFRIAYLIQFQRHLPRPNLEFLKHKTDLFHICWEKKIQSPNSGELIVFRRHTSFTCQIIEQKLTT